MWMRMRTRSPFNPCMLPPRVERQSESLPEREQLARQDEAAEGGDDREDHAAEHVRARALVLALFDETGGLGAEGGEGSVPTAEDGREQLADLHAPHPRGQ